MKKAIILSFILIFFNAEAQNVSALSTTKKSDSLFQIGQYNKAIPFFQDENNFGMLAKSYAALGRNLEAENYFEKAISEDSENRKLNFEFAKLLFQDSNYKKADSIFEKLTLQSPGNPAYLYQRGLVKEALKDTTAIDFFLKVQELDKKNISASYKIARNYVENRKFSEAKFYIENGLQENENSIKFLTLQALDYFHLAEFHDAITTYNVLLSKGEYYSQLYENLATSYMRTNQFEKAIEQYSILLSEFDNQENFWHYKMASAYKSLKEYEKAKNHINSALEIQKKDISEGYLAMATIFQSEKKYADEMEFLLKVLEENPKNESAHYRLAISADNRYADKTKVLKYYENYLKSFGDTGKMRELAKHRVSDLKKELHFSKD